MQIDIGGNCMEDDGEEAWGTARGYEMKAPENFNSNYVSASLPIKGLWRFWKDVRTLVFGCLVVVMLNIPSDECSGTLFCWRLVHAQHR